MPRLIIAALFAAVLAPLIAPSVPSPMRATCVVDGAPALPATVMFRAVVPGEGALVAECAVVEPIIVPAAAPDGWTPQARPARKSPSFRSN